jgi:hypothetical protein
MSDMRKTKKELLQELFGLRSRLKKYESTDPIAAKEQQLRDSEASDAVEHMTPEGVAQRLTEAQLAVSKTFVGLQQDIQTQLKELDVIRDAISAKGRELQELHDKDVLATSLSIMMSEHDDKKRELAAELAAKEAEIAEEKAAMERELAAREKELEFELRNRHVEKDQQLREHERREMERINETIRTKNNEFRTAHEERMRSWKQREETLKDAEEELAELRVDAEQFGEKMKKEAEKQVAIATSSLKRDYEHKMQLAQMESANEQKVAQQTIETLSRQLLEQRQIADTLLEELSTAKEQITSVANSALEASSGRFAMEQVMADRGGRDGQTAKGRG